MEYWLYLTYLITIIAIIITPGPNAMLMVSHSLNHGQRAVINNAFGSVSASTLLIIISLLGIKSLIPDAYLSWISLVGSLYLAYLGVSNLRTQNFVMNLESHPRAVSSHRKFFYQAFLTGISNPKDILFFVVLLPQFIDTTLSFATSATLLLLGWMICDFIIMYGYGALALKIKQYVKPAKILLFIKIAGAIILIFAGILFTSTLMTILQG